MAREIATFLGPDKCSFFLSGFWSEIDDSIYGCEHPFRRYPDPESCHPQVTSETSLVNISMRDETGWPPIIG